MATIYDVARRARTSTYTVSAVLNRSANVSPELTRRVMKAVRDLDYTINDVARSLQTHRTQTVAMLIPDIGNPFYAQVVRGVEDVVRKSGYSLLLGNTYNDPEQQSRYLTVFRSKQADGLLLFVAPGGGEDVRRLVEKNKPVVFVGRTPSRFEADTVTADNVAGAHMATEYLISKGHRRIGIITGHLSLSPSSERVRGWRRALRKAGIGAHKRLIGEGDWSAESGWRLAGVLMDLTEPPTAIFVANFVMMTGALRALKERRIAVPSGVEVMSSDDSEWLDVIEPRISTVLQPSYDMGVRAAELLLKRVQEPGRKHERIVLQPELRIRS